MYIELLPIPLKILKKDIELFAQGLHVNNRFYKNKKTI